MKTVFKPLGLAAAVAAVTAGYAGIASAVPVQDVGELGDLAIVPYYTTQGSWITGVHIINSVNYTQVVKLRLRRATDSADALDFNLIMSPYDEWTGFIDDSTGDIIFQTDDNTCTAPELPGGQAIMPAIFRQGAEEGYLEVIGMGRPGAENMPIAVAAKHGSDGVPLDCAAVRSNFFKKAPNASSKGVTNNFITNQTVASVEAYNTNYRCAAIGTTTMQPTKTYTSGTNAGTCENTYVDSPNSLKVSYFFRDAAAGAEAGGNATHIRGFSDEAWMSNQQFGLLSGDIGGFDYPDLNGGPLGYTTYAAALWVTPGGTAGTANRGRFNLLRNAAALGSTAVLNDWSVATARNVSTDWVVTMPGQYTMVDFGVWASPQVGFDFDNCGTLNDPNTAIDDGIALCDFRDIPVIATLDLWDREEGVITSEEGGLVISPAPPGTTNRLILPYEVNVIEWTDGVNAPVLGSSYATAVDVTPLGAEFGWANLAVAATPKSARNGTVGVDVNVNGQAVCDYVPYPPFPGASVTAVTGGGDSSDMRTLNNDANYVTLNGEVCGPALSDATHNIPITGFVMWERTFTSAAENYARLIDHSFRSM